MLRASIRLGLLALVVASSPALPAEAEPGVPASTELRARQHFDRAQVLYSLQRFQDALAEYEAAFELTELPGFLFNIGQCHRNLGRNDQAVLAFRRYLRVRPDARDRAEVEHLISDLEAHAEDDRRRRPAATIDRELRDAAVSTEPHPPAEVVVAKRLDAALAPRPPRRPPIYRRWWFITGVVVGAVTAVAIAARDRLPDSDLGAIDFSK